MNSDQEVHPIEIAYLRDLIEGMKPSKAASRRKDRYRAATQRRLKAEERSVQAQHRDRQLLQQLSGLSRRDLYETDAIDKAIESSTEVVDATGVVLTENTNRESAFREKRRKPITHGSVQDRLFDGDREETTNYSAALFSLRRPCT